jgi:segregation and condensation protein B
MERAMGGHLGDPELPAEEPSEDSGEAARGRRSRRTSVKDVSALDHHEEINDEPIPESDGAPFVHALASDEFDAEMTVNLVGEMPLPGRDDLDEPTVAASGDTLAEVDSLLLQRRHLRGLVEALVFASDSPITPKELAKLASAPQKLVKELLAELKTDYSTRGMHLDEVAGGWVFRTSPQYAPFVRDLTKQKPVRLTRAQVETLAIIAYRQPITRPEVDDVRGVDSGPVLKLLLERDLVRILGKRDEPGRPLIYGTTSHFLEFFGLKSLKDLPTLREFTELSDESREAFEDELGETPGEVATGESELVTRETGHDEGGHHHASSDDDPSFADSHAGRTPHESMRVPVGEHVIDDLGEDDLEPLEAALGDHVAISHVEHHAADDDGPTITSEAPTSDDDDDDD